VTCAWCLSTVRARRADATYCSPTCRVAAHRSKRRHATKAQQSARRGRGTAGEVVRGKRLQLRQYEEIVANGKGTDWLHAKIESLRLELA